MALHYFVVYRQYPWSEWHHNYSNVKLPIRMFKFPFLKQIYNLTDALDKDLVDIVVEKRV